MIYTRTQIAVALLGLWLGVHVLVTIDKTWTVLWAIVVLALVLSDVRRAAIAAPPPA
jgi:hypothetical protein